MRPSLLEILVDPRTHAALELADGRLVAPDGTAYPVRDGIPRFVDKTGDDQQQTAEAFGFKWTRRESFGSEGMRAELGKWLLKRYGFADAGEMRAYFGSRRRTLDAGCGAGFATSIWMSEDWSADEAEWVGVDISEAIDVARDSLGGFPGTHFVQADVLALPFANETFDSVISEGVLHHTPSTERAFHSLVRVLARSGELMAYIYRRKAPMREFTDDHIRSKLAALSPHEAWEAMRPLTELARGLAELAVEVDVPDVPVLGIGSGRYDVQRLIYWNMAKLFWNPAMTFEENVHVNFDWYAPRYAHRHTEEEIRAWCDEAGVEITRLDVDDAGFTVRARKP